MACADLFGCRSVNVHKDSNGKEMCELNDSSKSTDPGSMVSKTGYDHYELTVITSQRPNPELYRNNNKPHALYRGIVERIPAAPKSSACAMQCAMHMQHRYSAAQQLAHHNGSSS